MPKPIYTKLRSFGACFVLFVKVFSATCHNYVLYFLYGFIINFDKKQNKSNCKNCFTKCVRI